MRNAFRPAAEKQARITVTLNKIVEALPRERITYLFSATMTQKVDKLQRASLRNPVKVQVSEKYQTVSTLIQEVAKERWRKG